MVIYGQKQMNIGHYVVWNIYWFWKIKRLTGTWPIRERNQATAHTLLRKDCVQAKECLYQEPNWTKEQEEGFHSWTNNIIVVVIVLVMTVKLS